MRVAEYSRKIIVQLLIEKGIIKVFERTFTLEDISKRKISFIQRLS